jgi:hypothetical protein
MAACLVFGARSARADDSGAHARSVTLFREGVIAGKAGDYPRAESAFRASYALSPSPSTLRNWALTEMRLGKMVEALGHLKLAAKAPGLTAEQRSIVAQNLDDAYAATGHVAVRTTEGAQVAIDGVPVEGAAPFEGPLDVAPGRRQIEARLGPASAHAEVDAPAGQIVEVSVPIAPLPAAKAAPAAPLAAPVLATDPARPPGAGGESSQAATWWTPPHSVAVGLAGAAAVGLGLGLYFEARAQATASDVNGTRGSLTGACTGPSVPLGCAGLRDQIDAVHEDDVLKNVSLALGAAAGVGAAIVLVVAGPGAQAQIGSARWAPTVGPGSAGIRGSF